MKSETQSTFGRGTRNWRLTRSSGHGAALSLIVVRTGLPDHAFKAHGPHQPLHRAARDLLTLGSNCGVDMTGVFYSLGVERVLPELLERFGIPELIQISLASSR